MSLFGPPNVEKMIAKKDVKGLIKVLLHGKDLMLRKKAARALGDLGNPEAVYPLIVVLQRDELSLSLSPEVFAKRTSANNELRVIAAKALGVIGDERAVSVLTGIRDDQTLNGGVLDLFGTEKLRESAESALWDIRVAIARKLKPSTVADQPEEVEPEQSRTGTKLPASLPGPIPKHIFVPSGMEGPSGPGDSEFQTALEHWNAERYDQAKQSYLEAIDLGLTPEFEAAARSNLGKICLMQDDVEMAVDQFIKGLYLNPQSASTVYSCASYLALIYEELGFNEDCRAAVEVAKSALKRINSIMSAQAAAKVKATVRRVYK